MPIIRIWSTLLIWVGGYSLSIMKRVIKPPYIPLHYCSILRSAGDILIITRKRTSESLLLLLHACIGQSLKIGLSY